MTSSRISVDASPERVAWLDGQALEADDLTAAVDREAFTRRLHTGVVHDAWGVALGLFVNPADPARVEVSPGLAYDRFGRELVSGRTLTLPGPPPPRDGNPRWIELVARWNDVTDLRAGGDPAGSCPGGAGATEERPLLRWVDNGPLRKDADGHPLRPSQYGAGMRLGLEVPLARYVVGADGALGQSDPSARRVAHGLVRPHIVAGTVRQGVIDIAGAHTAWSMVVDTSTGGFTTSSQTTYLVALGAHPWGDVSGFNSGEVSGGAQTARTLLAALLPVGLGPFLQISESDRTHFRLTVRHGLPARAVKARISVPRNPVTVHWVGIEWVGGCAPEPTFFQLLPFLFQGSAYYLQEGVPT